MGLYLLHVLNSCSSLGTDSLLSEIEFLHLSGEVFCVCKGKAEGKAVPLQAWSGPEGPRNLRFPDFMATAQDGGRLSALRAGRLYPQEILLVLISVRG